MYDKQVDDRVLEFGSAEFDRWFTEHLEDELKVSRSVVREAVRVLQSLGLVETTKRVGIRVLPANRWMKQCSRAGFQTA